MKLHEETARSQLLTENESNRRDAVDKQVTAAEAKHAGEREDLLAKLHAAEAEPPIYNNIHPAGCSSLDLSVFKSHATKS